MICHSHVDLRSCRQGATLLNEEITMEGKLVFLSLVATWCCVSVANAAVPTLDDLESDWINPNVPVSEAAKLDGNQRDLATINNFWGSVGIAPEGVRPVDLFAINALELPPYTGCGASSSGHVPYGCGRLLVNGAQVPAQETKWHAGTAGRRSGKVEGIEGLEIETATRMRFEANTILWQINISNMQTTGSLDAFQLTLELSAMVEKLSSVGTWVFPAISDVSKFKYAVLRRGTSIGVTATGLSVPTHSSKPASAAFVCIGSSIVPEISVEASKVPSATFTISKLPAGNTLTLRLALTVADDGVTAVQMLDDLDSSAAQFDAVWTDSAAKWQARWEAVFDPEQEDFSGNLPVLDITSKGGAEVERIYYTSILTCVTQVRTNLPIVHKTVFVNGQGNLGGTRGIGGATSWWWDESLTSIMFALLEPAGRVPTLQAWLHSDPTATGSNHYALDCAPPGTTNCNFNSPESGSAGGKDENLGGGPPRGFYCYNLWALFMTLSNHLRINNDVTFLKSQAGSTNMTVEEALANVATFWKNYIINDTYLVDFDWIMDGFSRTYQHVMPGCSQGNNVWMMREMAQLYDVQKRGIDAQAMRDHANFMSNDTIRYMYQKGGGYFNLIYPGSSEGTLTAHEYRHLVDFFSVTFGLCGAGHTPCDFDKYPGMREEMANWFRNECVTKTWTRATSPKTNCSHSWEIKPGREQLTTDNKEVDDSTSEWPGYTTCNAGRPDHGTTGSYPSWPAFSLEALCYLENYNCASAMEILASFAANTHEGPIGQATYTPQLLTPPYTPLNDELSFKPVAGVTRYLGIEGGSFFDAIVRGFFGYHPPMQWPGGDQQSVLNSTLVGINVSHGFTGTLSNLRTPFGLATIEATTTGLTITLQK